MKYWLLKSEPNAFSVSDLKNCKNQTEPWDGIRNYQARNFMTNEMKNGDLAFFYHSNTKIPAIVGIVKIVKESYPDPSAFDVSSDYFDPKSTAENPRWFMVDVKFIRDTKIMPLNLLKTIDEFDDFALIKKGNRLSIIPVSQRNWNIILDIEKGLS